MNKRTVTAGLVGVVLALSSGGCYSHSDSRVHNIRINSKESRVYLKESQNRMEGEENLLIKTYLTKKPQHITLGMGGVEFNTLKLSSDSYVAVWEKEGNERDVIFCNGLGSSSFDLAFMGRSLAESGTNFYAIDRAGSGINSPLKPNTKAWISDIVEVAEDKRPAIMGQCFSTGLVAEVIDKNPDTFSQAIYLTPSFHLNYGVSLLEAVEIFLTTSVGLDLSYRNPVPFQAYTSKSKEIEFLEEDPFFSRFPTGQTMIHGKILTKYALEKIRMSKVPATFILSSDDAVVDNEKTLEELRRAYSDNMKVKIIKGEHFMPFDDLAIRMIERELEK